MTTLQDGTTTREGLTGAHAPQPAGRPERPAGRGALLRRASWALAVAVPVAFLGIFFVWPVGALVGRGFWADGTLDLGGFADVFSQPRTWRIVGLTLAQATLGTAVSLLLGIPGAYVL